MQPTSVRLPEIGSQWIERRTLSRFIVDRVWFSINDGGDLVSVRAEPMWMNLRGLTIPAAHFEADFIQDEAPSFAAVERLGWTQPRPGVESRELRLMGTRRLLFRRWGDGRFSISFDDEATWTHYALATPQSLHDILLAMRVFGKEIP